MKSITGTIRSFWIVFAAALCVAAAGLLYLFYNPEDVNGSTPGLSAVEDSAGPLPPRLATEALPSTEEADTTNAVDRAPTMPEFVIPPSALLTVPFTSQAPRQEWDPPFDETCEEASIVMAHAYATHRALTPESAEQEMLDSIEWEKQHIGSYLDTTIAEVSEVLEQHYRLSTRIEQASVERIHDAIAHGNVVILPTAGKELSNPHFTPPGPWYHMLVVIGYDEDELITNDPGTRFGAGYRYQTDVLMNAVHDWTGEKTTINEGKKLMLVVENP